MEDGAGEVTCHCCFCCFPVDATRVEEHLGRTYQRCPRCYASALVVPPDTPPV